MNSIAKIIILLSAICYLLTLPFNTLAQIDNTAIANSDTLASAYITTSRVVKRDTKTDYIITQRNIQKASNIYSLIDQIPGLHYNTIDQTVELFGSSEYAITVNGIQMSKQEIDAISPDLVKKISIIHTPSGKWLSMGVKYVIDIHLKEEDGILLNVQNLLITAPENDENLIANEQPRVHLQYVKGKFTANAGYGYGNIHWNYKNSFNKIYPDGSKLNNYSLKHPTEFNSSLNHNGYARAIYNFNENNLLTASLDYQSGKYKILNNTSHVMEVESETTNVEEFTYDMRECNDWKASLYWLGHINVKWAISASANLNSTNFEQLYIYSTNDNLQESSLRNSKRYSYQNIDISYTDGNKLGINFGINGIYNRYKVINKTNQKTTMNRSYRKADIYGYISYNLTDNLNLYGGLKLGYVNDESNEKYYVAPLITLNYFPQSIFGLIATYNAEPSYPKQHQLDNTLYRIDKILYQQGNPMLPSTTISHIISLQMSFWNKLYFTNFLLYSPKEIADFYINHEDKIISTYTSQDLLQYSTLIEHTWEITKNWQWNNSIQLNYFKIKDNISTNDAFNITGNSVLQYYSEKIGLTAQIEYWRNLNKIPSLQGYYETGYDMWNLSVDKFLFKKKLSLSLSYVIPLDIGIRQNQETIIRSTGYMSKNNLNLNIYDNMLVFRMIFRINHGKHTQTIDDNTSYSDESRRGRDLY